MLVTYEGNGAFKANPDYIDHMVTERELYLKSVEKGWTFDVAGLTDVIDNHFREIGFEDIGEIRQRLSFMVEQIVRARKNIADTLSAMVLDEATRQADEAEAFQPS